MHARAHKDPHILEHWRSRAKSQFVFRGNFALEPAAVTCRYLPQRRVQASTRAGGRRGPGVSTARLLARKRRPRAQKMLQHFYANTIQFVIEQGQPLNRSITRY